MQHERPPFATISGTTLQLGARDTIAIYVWNELSWVARFRNGRGELSDAATWFRVHAGLLRSGRVGPVATIDTVETLSPEMTERIAQLHQDMDARRALRPRSSTTSGALRRICAHMASTLSAWSARATHRPG